MQEETRTLKIHEKTYELRTHQHGARVEVLGTPYEIYKHEQNFNVYRVEADGVSACCGENINSEIAAIELAEIFERLIIYSVNTGFVKELEILKHYLNEWELNPPRKINI